MDWVSQFKFAFLGPAALFTLLLSLGWLNDNLSYEWKHWTTKQTVGAFLTGPVVGLLLMGVVMVVAMVYQHQEFVFERWWTATSFPVVALWIMKTKCKHFWRERTPEEEERRKRLIQEYQG